MAATEPLASDWVPEDSFAARLILVRAALGHITQQEAARRCDLDDGSWSNWERGTKPRDFPRIVRQISVALGVDKDWLAWGGSLSKSRCSERLACVELPPGVYPLTLPFPEPAGGQPSLAVLTSASGM